MGNTKKRLDYLEKKVAQLDKDVGDILLFFKDFIQVLKR